ncbi:hypothetical protein SAMN04488494_0617 [Xylanibacter ruminicola]|uniref:Uncharacterized protein n=1 Tax=Xylanibacter ruminicola TaxID=839 RepID=A0A1M7D3G1_XYLRU|nr:tail fiber domain-containing protein [Xylanibacter ruminicola]SHL74061.1 hypothetical protein SAMN04488494_0617 [Xylanibacter ruminicola]
MAKWTIFDKHGVAKVSVVELELRDEWMAECYLTVTIRSATPIKFAIGDYIDYRGERYTIQYDPNVLKKASSGSYGEGFTYSNIKFVGLQDEIVRCDFNDIVLRDNQMHYTALPTFPFYCETVDDLLDRIQANLEELYPAQWTIIGLNTLRNKQRGTAVNRLKAFTDAYKTYIDQTEATKTEPYGKVGVAETVDKITCWDALKKVHDDFGLNFIIRGRVIIVGTAGVFTASKFRYGKGNGLYEIERIAESDQQIVTRLRAYGSEDNLPSRYYANTTEDMPNNMAVSKLMLPGFPTQSLADWVDAHKNAAGYEWLLDAVNEGFAFSKDAHRPYIDSPNIKEYGIRPSSIIFDGSEDKENIHPTIEGMVYDGKAIDEIYAADQIEDNGVSTENPNNFKITLPALGFDLGKVYEDSASIDIKNGMCGARSFKMVSAPTKNSDGRWVCTVERVHDDVLDLWFPYNDFQIKQGDKFVLTGIKLPDEYISSASVKLFKASIEALRKNHAPRYTYQPRIDEIWMQRQHDLAVSSDGTTSLHDTLKAGDIFSFADDDLAIDANIIIDVLTIKENGNNGVPTYEVTLRDEKQVGTMQKITNKIDSAFTNAVTTAVGGGLTSRQVQRLIERFGSEQFLSKLDDDTAAGFIKMLKGLQIGNSYVPGLLGEGGVLRMDADGKTYLEADKMYIRMKAYFDSVEVREYKHSVGNRVASPAGAKCVRVEWLGANNKVLEQTNANLKSVKKFRCFFRASDGEDTTRNNFVVGDQIYCHVTTVAGSSDNPESKGQNQKHYWRLCVGCNTEGTLTKDGEAWIDLSNNTTETISSKSYTGYQTGSDIPEAQDSMIQLGNVNDTTRQGAIIEFVSGNNAPAYQIYQGINSFSLNGKSMITMGYNSATGKAELKVHGNAYIGDPNGSAFLSYDSAKKELKIKAKVEILPNGSTIGNKTFAEYIKENQNNYDDSALQTLLANKYLGLLTGGSISQSIGDAQDAADKAQGAADDAQKTADDANTAAGKAQTSADNAQKSANTANQGVKDAASAAKKADDKAAAAQKKADEAYNKAATFNYLSQALSSSTEIDGGLILSTLIALRDKSGAIWSGINGAYNEDDETVEGGALGHGIAAWYGGRMIDHEATPTLADYAKILFRHDGSGYLAGGNISWNKLGKVTIKDIYTDVSGSEKKLGTMLNDLMTFNNAFHFRLNGNNVLGIVPQVTFDNLSIGGNAVATQKWVNETFVTKAFFDNIFRLYNGYGSSASKIAVNGSLPSDTSKLNIEAVFSFWTKKAIASLGQGDDGSTTYSALAQLNDVKVSSPAVDQVLAFNGTHWYNKTLELGSLTLAGLSDVAISNPAANQMLAYDATNKKWVNIAVPATGVTSVGLTMPTGFSVASSPITAKGTLAVTFTSGYSLPTTAKQTNWDKAYGWGNHASAGYVKSVKIGTTSYSPASGVITLPAYPTDYYSNATSRTANYVLAAPDGEAGVATFRALVAADIPSLTKSKISDFPTTWAWSAITGKPTTWAWASITGKPTTIAGYGITDAKIADGVITIGANTIKPLTSHQSLAAYTKTANYKGLRFLVGENAIGSYSPTSALDLLFAAGSNIALTIDDKTHTLTIANTYSYSHPTGGANTTIAASNGKVLSAITVNSLGHVTSVSSKALAAADIPNLSGTYAAVSRVSALEGYFTNGVAKKAVQLNTARSLWGNSFNGTGDINGNIVMNTANGTFIQIGGIRIVYDSANNALKVVKSDGTTAANFYATGGLASLGETTDGSAGVGDVTWALLESDKDTRQVAHSHLTTALSTYATQAWVSENFNKFNLPAATADVLGGVKVGYATSGKNYAVQLDGDNKMFVNVPWTDNNNYNYVKIIQSDPSSLTSYWLTLASGTGDKQLNINDSIKYKALSGSTSVLGRAELYIGNSIAKGKAKNMEGKLFIYSSTANAAVIACAALTATRNFTLPDKTGTFAMVSDIPTDNSQLANGAGYLKSISAATSSSYGGIKTGYTASGKNYAVVLNDDGQAYVNVPWTNTTYTFTNKGAKLAWDTTSTIATVGGVDIKVTMPANPNTDHYAWSDITGKPSFNYLPLSGGTLTGDLVLSKLIMYGGTDGTREFSITKTDGGKNIDIAWNWRNNDGAGLALRSVDMESGAFALWAKSSGGYKQLWGNANGTLTWDGNTVLTAKNSSVSLNGSTLTVKINGEIKSLTNTDTTYSANNGVGLSGTTFYNSGVRAATINGNYLRINTNGTNADLTIPYATSAGSVAWSNVTGKPAFNYLPLSGGTLTGLLTANGGVTIASSKTLKIGDIYIGYDAEANAIEIYKLDGTTHIAANLYARGGVASLGEITDGSAGVGDVTWDLLANDSDTRQVALSHLTTALSTYATLDWVNNHFGYTASGKNYAVQLDTNGKMFVNVPWTDNNTTYSAATQSANGLMSAADKKKLDGIAAGANKYTYTLPTATADVLGGIKIGYTNSGKNYAVALDANGNAYVNVPWTDNNTTYSFVNKGATLAWGATATIATVGGVDIKVTMPGNPDTNTWRPLGTGANDACAGNDARLSNARPASDVYAWAKAATKPSYAWSEITGKPSLNYLPLAGGTLTGLLTANAGIAIASSKTLKIGDIYLGYDSDNNAIEIYKLGEDDAHIAADLYTRGGITALGETADGIAGSGTGDVTWALLESDSDTRQISHKHLTTALSIYAQKSEAIKNITRNGTTFTATRADGTTFTFTQQDNDHYAWSDITGKPSTFAPSAHNHASLNGHDLRTTNNAPSWYMSNVGAASIYTEFCQTGGATTDFENRTTFTPWGDNSGQRPVQLAFNNHGMFMRTSASDTAWNSWNKIVHSGNFSDYGILASEKSKLFVNYLTDVKSYYDGKYTTLKSGAYLIGFGGYTGSLLHFQMDGSCSGLDICIPHYSGTDIFIRKTVDSARFERTSWTKLITVDNIGQYASSGGGSYNGGNIAGTFSSSNGVPLQFTGVGSGTYNVCQWYCQSNGITLETPRATDSPSATSLPFMVKTRGGQYGTLKAGDVWVDGTLYVKEGYGVESRPSGDGLLVYHPYSYTGVASSQWGVGAVSCQGVIRSDNSDLLHYKGNDWYTILDTSNGIHKHNMVSSNGNIPTWGTLTAGNGYSAGAIWNFPGGSDLAFAYKSGQVSMQVDGYFYQNEGNYRVCDVSGFTMNTGARISFGNTGTLIIGNSNNGGWLMLQDVCSMNGTAETYWSIRTNGNAVFQNVTSNGSLSALSDKRHKRILSKVELTVERLAAMPTIRYKWCDGRADKSIYAGSIAQDWQTVLPEVVKKADDVEGTLSLDYGVAALVAAISTARKVVDHERRIKELERENLELRQQLNKLIKG